MAYATMGDSKIGKYTVYVHTMPNGKKYVGVTGQNPEERFRNGKGYIGNSAFYDDILYYGWQSVNIELAFVTESKQEALDKEGELIAKYNTTDPSYGYNLWKSGSSNSPVASVGRHISEAKMGHEVTEATREKLRQYGRKKCVCLDKHGEIVRIYDSLTEAADDVGAFKTNIYAVCMHKKPTSRGYRWMYLDEFLDSLDVVFDDRLEDFDFDV